MKKTVLSILILCAVTLPVFAANSVSEIEVDAAVYKDGSMYVTQTWDGNFDEGTEIFIPMNAPDYMKISDLTVTDINGTYKTVDDWNVQWSFEEKANKCGVNYVDGGYEICFGISAYGQNRYAIEYKLDKVAGGYTDMDGANFRFANEQMNTVPTDVTVRIRLADGRAITDDIADIWGFGFDGQVGFDNGAIIAYTKSPINEDNHVTVLFGLQKGVISPTRTENVSFETVKNAAFEGSDYTYDSGGSLSGPVVIALMVGFVVLPIVLVVAAFKISKRNKERKFKAFFDKFGYFRDIPNGGNTNATYALGRLFEMCQDGAILATSMLKLIDLGYLVPVTEEEVGFMGKTKETVNFRLTGSGNGKMDEYSEYLYTVLEGAAGQDGVLQAKELENYADKHDVLLRNYINKCDATGREYLNKKHCLKRWDSPTKLKYLTENGEKELGELMGFKKYLEDFSLIAERGVKEMPVWKELLSYATLFGIADKVALQMKELYPNIAVEVESYSRSMYTASSYQYIMYRNMKNAEDRRIQAKRSSGSGGFASMGGGGGSMGGGRGGGSR